MAEYTKAQADKRLPGGIGPVSHVGQAPEMLTAEEIGVKLSGRG